MTQPPDLPSKAARPTRRQAEYLTFIQAFTKRWGIPPSFDDIGRHFRTTPPSVNTMVKMLDARGFLTRIPGQARTLRVIALDEWLSAATPETNQGVGSRTPAAKDDPSAEVVAATHVASLVIERLVPALKGVGEKHLLAALDAVAEAVETVGRQAGASAESRAEARLALRRVALIAQGCSPERAPPQKRSRARKLW